MVVADTLAGLLAPTINGLGYELLGIEQQGSGSGLLVRLYIDSVDGIGVKDCEKVSRQVSDVLDVEAVINGEYTLEVSSPGLDRPLFTADHYIAHIGANVKLKLRSLVDGRRRLAGKLVEATAEKATIEMGEERFEVPYHFVERAHLDPQWQ